MLSRPEAIRMARIIRQLRVIHMNLIDQNESLGAAMASYYACFYPPHAIHHRLPEKLINVQLKHILLIIAVPLGLADIFDLVSLIPTYI